MRGDGIKGDRCERGQQMAGCFLGRLSSGQACDAMTVDTQHVPMVGRIGLIAGVLALVVWCCFLGITLALSPVRGRDVHVVAVAIPIVLLVGIAVGAYIQRRQTVGLWLVRGAFGLLLLTAYLTLALPEMLPSLVLALVACLAGLGARRKTYA